MTDQQELEILKQQQPDLVAAMRAVIREETASDLEMLFRCLMQLARHLARKYGFTIKQWPES